jgi:hypothetical protein
MTDEDEPRSIYRLAIVAVMATALAVALIGVSGQAESLFADLPARG